MPKTKNAAKYRIGAITPELLPIPTEEEQSNDIYELYPTGPQGGWTDGELPDEFYNELNDLLLRYGGIDSDADARIQVTVVDRKKHDTFHFQPIKRLDWEGTLKDHLDYLSDALMNQDIANDIVKRATRLLRDRKDIP